MKKNVGTLPVEGCDGEKQSNEIRFLIPVSPPTPCTPGAGRPSTLSVRADTSTSRSRATSRNCWRRCRPGTDSRSRQGDLPPDLIEDPVKDHGRIGQRAIRLTDKLNGHVSFLHVRLAFAVRRTVTDPKGKKKPRVEIAFGITSPGKDGTTAEEVLATNRKHWSVETAHHILDSSHAFDEDASLIRTGHGPENMACPRRFALTVLRHHQKKNGQPITEQLRRLCLNPRRIPEYLRLTGNTRPRRTAAVPGDRLPLAA